MTPVTIHLPDDIAAQYQQDELPRCVLEDFAIQESARGRLTLLQLRQLLGLPSRFAPMHSSTSMVCPSIRMRIIKRTWVPSTT
jgi:hypothetical protein